MAFARRTTDSLALAELLFGLRTATTATAATAATEAATTTSAVTQTTSLLHPLLPSPHARACSADNSSPSASASASASAASTSSGGSDAAVQSGGVYAAAPLRDDPSSGGLLHAATDESPPAIGGGSPGVALPHWMTKSPPLAHNAPARAGVTCANNPAPLAGSLNLNQQQQNALAAAALIASVLRAANAANAATGRREGIPAITSASTAEANSRTRETLVPEPQGATDNTSLRKQLLLHAQRNSWERMPSVVPGSISSGGSASFPSSAAATLSRLCSPADVSTSSLSALLSGSVSTSPAERGCYSESLAMALRAANEVTRLNIVGGRENMSGSEFLDGLAFGQRERLSRGSKRCPQCGRIFSSGQALGGHMRKHWKGPKRPEQIQRHAKDSLGVSKSSNVISNQCHNRSSSPGQQLSAFSRQQSEESLEMEKEQVEDGAEIDLDLRL
ncbi:hypothetical protein CLOM_g6831 [Closterium sp. NIES-68]|nr:hypothetical protein CLOM_g6831 [Closterium sp. NIES-68]GJP75039.1 hypothetical protein CLOP_g5535 [Closterium sp. NIES-67]